MIQLLAPRGFERTADILQQQLGLDDDTQAVVCYGKGYDGPLPALNAACGKRNKFEQGRLLMDSGVPVIQHLTPEEAFDCDEQVILVGRKLQHTRGRDIMLAIGSQDRRLRAQAGAAFFTKLHPSDNELRVWVCRANHLATYEKVLSHPEQYKGFGRNYHNGWGFRFVERASVPVRAIAIAKDAVRALELDFGAVDMLQCGDDFIVLEVNTAPGVEGDNRVAITNLVKAIKRWQERGYSKRKEFNDTTRAYHQGAQANLPGLGIGAGT